MLLQAFAAWYLGRNPRRKIIAAGSGAELAQRNSRASRAFFNEPDWPLEVELSKSDDGAESVGNDGRRCGNLLLLDDLQNDALSQTERESPWQWFREVLMPRLEASGTKISLLGETGP
jgi:hypothetical protein